MIYEIGKKISNKFVEFENRHLFLIQFVNKLLQRVFLHSLWAIDSLKFCCLGICIDKKKTTTFSFNTSKKERRTHVSNPDRASLLNVCFLFSQTKCFSLSSSWNSWDNCLIRMKRRSTWNVTKGKKGRHIFWSKHLF